MVRLVTVPSSPTGAVIDITRQAPPITVAQLVPGAAVALIMAHPDDETLGSGLALAAAAVAGRQISLVLATNGEGSHLHSLTHPKPVLKELRRNELKCALDVLIGANNCEIICLNLEDGQSDPDQLTGETLGELIDTLAGAKISAIWTNWYSDPHCDHTTAAIIAQRCGEALQIPVWACPIWGRFTQDAPPPETVRRFEETGLIERKKRAIACYRSQFTDLIKDDPSGFIMPLNLLEHFAVFPEIFIRVE